MRYDTTERDQIAELRDKYKALERKKTKWHFYFPHRLRFPLIWTLFSAIIGIAQQSIMQKKFVFVQFFGSSYLSWFSSFGEFSSIYQISGENALLLSILSNWYYFFFTGGLVSLIWAILYVLIYSEFKVRHDDFA